MSIINEALKKAEKENQQIQTPASKDAFSNFKTESLPKKILSASRRRKLSFIYPKWKLLLLVVIVLWTLIMVKAMVARIKIPEEVLAPQKKPDIVLPKTAPEDLEALEPSQEITETPTLKAEEELVPQSLPELYLNGIISGGGGEPYAIINNRVVKEGDLVEKAKVLKIHNNHVIFLFEDKEYILKAR